MVRPIPEGYATVTAQLVVAGAAEAIEFYRQAFGAQELSRMDAPDGRVLHSELRLGSSMLFVADEFEDPLSRAPGSLGATSVSLYLYVEDVDAVFRQAVQAGALPTMAVQTMFWGDRLGQVRDPWGHVWDLASRVEEVPPEELASRQAQWFAEMQQEQPED
jgi:PhnB protein